MRFTSAIVAAFALATSVLAQTEGFAAITAPTRDEDVEAGSEYEIEWQPGNTPESALFTITLLQGADPGKLDLGNVIAAAVPNSGSYTWSVPEDLTFATYGIKISLDSNPTTFQYSNPFHITGGSASSSTISSSTSMSSSTISSSESMTVATATSSPSSTVTGITTSIPSPTSTTESSTVVIETTAAPTTLNGTATATPTTMATIPAGNGGNGTVPTGSPTSTPPVVPSNGAVAKAATGGFAMIGGLALAFVL